MYKQSPDFSSMQTQLRIKKKFTKARQLVKNKLLKHLGENGCDWYGVVYISQDREANVKGQESGRPRNCTQVEGNTTEEWRTARVTDYCQLRAQKRGLIGRSHHQTSHQILCEQEWRFPTKHWVLYCFLSLVWANEFIWLFLACSLYEAIAALHTLCAPARASKKAFPNVCTKCSTPLSVSSPRSIICSTAVASKSHTVPWSLYKILFLPDLPCYPIGLIRMLPN